MVENTKIEWAHHTFNPWMGCTKVGPGCDHCYAETLVTGRMGKDVWGPGKARVLTSEGNWNQPLRWNKKAAELGVRYRVFCASLADVFDNEVPEEWRMHLFELIGNTPNLDWLLLTKRIGNVDRFLPAGKTLEKDFPNVWLGATIVNQVEADRDIPKLLRIPAKVHFLSMEPLLGPVHIWHWLRPPVMTGRFACSMGPGGKPPRYIMGPPRIEWVIVGGESGKDARPMHPQWARDLRDQCEAEGVPFLFKQWGEWAPYNMGPGKDLGSLVRAGRVGIVHPSARESVDILRESGGRCQSEPFSCYMERVGKKAAGRLLGRHEHNGFPGNAA